MVQTSNLTLLLLVDSSEALLNIIHVYSIYFAYTMCVCVYVCVYLYVCVVCVCARARALLTGLPLPPSW